MIDVFGVKKLAVIIHPAGPSIFSTLGNHMKSCKFTSLTVDLYLSGTFFQTSLLLELWVTIPFDSRFPRNFLFNSERSKMFPSLVVELKESVTG